MIGRVVVVLVTASVLAGCVSAADHPVVTMSGELGADDLGTLQLAEEVLVRRCLADAGFSYQVDTSAWNDRDFPYVLDDLGWAAAHGYGAQVWRNIDVLPPEAANCRAAAQRDLYGDLHRSEVDTHRRLQFAALDRARTLTS